MRKARKRRRRRTRRKRDATEVRVEGGVAGELIPLKVRVVGGGHVVMRQRARHVLVLCGFVIIEPEDEV